MGNRFFKAPEQRILIQGLDAAGKTSLLYRLKLGEVVVTIPTIGFNVETINVNGINITCWDVGGRDKIRPLFRHYYPNTHGFVYVIDSADRERLGDALEELIRYILLEEMTFNTVVMVLANKQDIPGAMTPLEIQEALQRKYTFSPTSASGHTVFVRPCSVVAMDGVYEAFEEFAEQIRLKCTGNSKSGLLPLSSEREIGPAVDEGAKNTAAALAKPDNEHQKESHVLTGIKLLCKNPVSYLKSLFYW